MASVCPNCGKKLHFYNVKAECSQCGVSIPNFNWEKRLEEDNANAEKKFQSFYRFGNRFAYSIWGTKLRIVRIILSFLPAVGFLLPWATLKSDAGSVGLDLFGMTCDTSLIDLFKDFFANSGVYFANMGYENYAGTLFYTMLALVFMLLSAIFIIVAFFMILFKTKKPNTKAMAVTDVLSVSSAIVSSVLVTLGVNAASAETAVNFGTVPLYNISGGVAWGFYVALALLVAATVINILVAKAPAKTDEQLEEERLQRKAIKDEKEAQKERERELARIENEKRAAAEQAEKVKLAKEKLAKRETKKK
ncbi:MAG: hypothetical protein SO393_06095 [Eubacterium sp.]|nr:hypothetical protein [Oscillospiraceae bacterium]MDY4608463.1 hypothetical protein [Eubacterium sp.]